MNARDRAVHCFRERYGGAPKWIIRSPGRVNLIGEHTDYNDGFVLPMAIDRGIWIALRSRSDGRVEVESLEESNRCAFSLVELRPHESGWGEYLKGMAKMLQSAGHSLEGWEGVISSDLPMSSGLSSSAALEMGVGFAFSLSSGFRFSGIEMARVGQRTENEWIGAKTGIMDQMIVANGELGSALFLDCRDLSIRSIVMPPDVVVVVMDTKTRHDHRTSGYHERRESCVSMAEIFGRSHLRDVGLEEFAARWADLDSVMRRRARHVLHENERVLAAAQALEEGASVELGRLMNQSHESLRDDFDVSSRELDAMVEIARRQPGCLGARMTGGGFGGCAIALIERDRRDGIESSISKAYESATGLTPKVFVTTASAGTKEA